MSEDDEDSDLVSRKSTVKSIESWKAGFEAEHIEDALSIEIGRPANLTIYQELAQVLSNCAESLQEGKIRLLARLGTEEDKRYMNDMMKL